MKRQTLEQAIETVKSAEVKSFCVTNHPANSIRKSFYSVRYRYRSGAEQAFEISKATAQVLNGKA